MQNKGGFESTVSILDVKNEIYKSTGVVYIPIPSLLQVGNNYYTKYGVPIVQNGNLSDFTIIPIVGGSDQVKCSKQIIEAKIYMNFQVGTQTGNGNRIIHTMATDQPYIINQQFTPSNGINPFRFQMFNQIDWIAPNKVITNVYNFNGSGTLTLLQPLFVIKYLNL